MECKVSIFLLFTGELTKMIAISLIVWRSSWWQHFKESFYCFWNKIRRICL